MLKPCEAHRNSRVCCMIFYWKDLDLTFNDTNLAELDKMALTLIPEVFIIFYLCLFVNLNELKLKNVIETPSSARGGQHRKRTDGADLRWLAQPFCCCSTKALNELWPHTKQLQSDVTVTDKFPKNDAW